MWRITGTCVTGSSHLKSNLPCQDYCRYQKATLGTAAVVIIAVADGAGSAPLSHLGSRATADFLVDALLRDLTNPFDVSEVLVKKWLIQARSHLENVAVQEQCSFSDLACTVLLGVSSEFFSFFVQIGDGAWVIQKGDNYIIPVWPSDEGYVNETTFLTSANWEKSAHFEVILGPISSVACFTDGIQRIALEMQTRSAHRLFFDPLFSILRESRDESSLLTPLREFLSSELVSERTDDDKTLVIACHIEPLLLKDVN